jgi:hypothetical protein
MHSYGIETWLNSSLLEATIFILHLTLQHQSSLAKAKILTNPGFKYLCADEVKTRL